MANITKVNIATIATSKQYIQVPVWEVDTEGYPSGFTVTAKWTDLQGSLFLGYLQDNPPQVKCPLNIGEKDFFTGSTLNIGHETTGGIDFNNTISGIDEGITTAAISGGSGWIYLILVLAHTTDDKYYATFRIVASDLGAVTAPDNSKYGYFVGGLNSEYTERFGAYKDIDAFQNIGNLFMTNDPYNAAGNSTTGGGGGTFDGTSDSVAVPSLPTVGATDSGFITLFSPTMTQLKNLADYMWTNPLFDIETGFKKLFSDPMDCILGLSVVPVTVPTEGAQNVNIGNLITSVTMNVASQQYIEVDCGSIDFTSKYFGSYLDYEPYTKMSLFVPYSGVHSVSADDIIGKVVNLVYHIDILTGSLVAFLKCGNSVLYEFNGACASNIPVNSMNYASTIENAIRIAVNIGTTVATAGAAAPATTAATASTMKNVATGINLAGSTAEGALSLKPNIDRAGSLGGTTGLMGNQIPYFIITRPRLCKPKNQNYFKGYPSFIECKVGDLENKGYTEFDTIVLENSYLTENEKNDLIGILKGGVYL